MSLTDSDRKIVAVVNAFAFLNPFSPEREEMERRFAAVTGGKSDGTIPERFEGFFRWVDQLPAVRRDFRRFAERDREAMRTTFLFEAYHRYVTALDELITRQLSCGERSCPAPFGRECVDRMVTRGFTPDEAVR